MSAQVFECRMCGQCCEGRGGIVLSPADLERLAGFLGETPGIVLEKYAEISNGKPKIKCGADGFCIFFIKGKGCSVHAGKPAICRAWPFFRGNLEDPASLAMARDFCPGIRQDISFAEFVAAGREYLEKNELVGHDSSKEANALIIDNSTRA